MCMGLLNIVDLLRWRLVCRGTRALVEATLRKSQEYIISQYLSNAPEVLNKLSLFRALITADAALALFLLDYGMLSQDLEICVPEEFFTQMMTFLHQSYVLWSIPNDRDTPADRPPERSPYLFLIRDPNHRRRRYLHVVKVYSRNAIVGLHTLGNSAMMCCFNADIMSCAYPSLTLRRRAMVREQNWMSSWISGQFDRARNLRHVLAGFTMSTYAHRLVEPPLNDVPSEPTLTTDPRWCMAHFGLCGCNSRYIGDMYCLTVVLHPTSPGWEYLLDASTENDGPKLYKWSFPDGGVDCIGPHQYREPDVEYLDDGLRGVRVSSVVFNLKPSFAGSHMVGCRRTVRFSVPDDVSQLDAHAHDLPVESMGSSPARYGVGEIPVYGRSSLVGSWAGQDRTVVLHSRAPVRITAHVGLGPQHSYHPNTVESVIKLCRPFERGANDIFHRTASNGSLANVLWGTTAVASLCARPVGRFSSSMVTSSGAPSLCPRLFGPRKIG